MMHSEKPGIDHMFGVWCLGQTLSTYLNRQHTLILDNLGILESQDGTCLHIRRTSSQYCEVR